MNKRLPLPDETCQLPLTAEQDLILSLSNIADDQADEIRKLEAAVAHQQAKIAALETLAAQHQAQIAALETQLAQQQTKIAALQARLAQQQAENATLQTKVQELTHRLNLNSSNSHIPPSANPLNAKPAPPKSPSGRRPGAQPKHKPQPRKPLPADEVIHLRPTHCHHCNHQLSGTDENPSIHQKWEIPPVKPHVTEYHRHRLTCTQCGKTTCAGLTPETKATCGPQLQATCAVLTGVYRLSIRNATAVLNTMFGTPISTGEVCQQSIETGKVLEHAFNQAQAAVQKSPINVDETGWKQGKTRFWVWVAVGLLATVFLIRRYRDRESLKALLGPCQQIVTSDRFSAYGDLPAERRQLCWAHLRRDFQQIIDREGAGKGIGKDLLELSDKMFTAWKKVRDGTENREWMKEQIKPMRVQLRAILTRGKACGCEKTKNFCDNVLSQEESLWTFVFHENVEPTNNAAERALRGVVLKRKSSQRSFSESGSRFLERIWTVNATCQQQKRNTLEFVTQTIVAARKGQPMPDLIPQPALQPTTVGAPDCTHP